MKPILLLLTAIGGCFLLEVAKIIPAARPAAIPPDIYTLEARYLVSSDRYIQSANGSKLIASIQFEGIFKKKGIRHISYSKPLYLDEYPSGQIQYTLDDGTMASYALPTDSFHFVQYTDMDSMLLRYHSGANLPGLAGYNDYYSFENGCRLWTITNETKTINGMLCQKASTPSRTGTNIVWFAPDLPVQVGPCGLLELPGLVVDAYFPDIHEKWTLTGFTTGMPIDDRVFWPAPFNAPFRFVNHIRSKQKTTR